MKKDTLRRVVARFKNISKPFKYFCWKGNKKDEVRRSRSWKTGTGRTT